MDKRLLAVFSCFILIFSTLLSAAAMPAYDLSSYTISPSVSIRTAAVQEAIAILTEYDKTTRIWRNDLYQVQTKLSLWKSFTTSSVIKGISWKPTKATRVLIRTDLKNKAIVAGYVMSGDLLSLSWIESIGIIIFRHDQSGYNLTILK